MLKEAKETDLDHALSTPPVEPLDGALFKEGRVTLSVERELGTRAVHDECHV